MMSAISSEDTLHKRLLTARLPALPQVLLRFLELCRRDDAGLDDIAKLIAQEPAMANRILTLAGSASRHQISSPRDVLQSLIVVGLESTKTALVSDSVNQVFDSFVAGRAVDLRSLWKHSLTAAVLARRIAKEFDYTRVEEAYLAGLLHDVGQLAMITIFPEQYFKAFSSNGDDTWLSNWESLAIGITHSEVGAWLAGRWHLDSYLADAILYHHEDIERITVAHPLVRITWLAHNLSIDANIDVEAFDLDQDKLDRIRDGVDDEVLEAATFLGIDLTRDEAEPEARGRLAEIVRPFALAGVQHDIKLSPASDFKARLQSVMTAGRSLFELGDGVLFQLEGSQLKGQTARQYLARLEELAIPLGPNGGCVGRAATNARLASTWDEGSPASILDQQLLRVLGGEGLFCLPLTSGKPTAVMAFSIDKEKAQLLRARPVLLDNFVREARKTLGISDASSPTGDANVCQDRMRRVVHEISNPLSIIQNYLHVLGERLAGQEAAADVAIVNSEIARVSRILSSLTAPAADQPDRPDRPTGRGNDLNQAVRELVEFCRDTGFTPPGIALDLTLADDLPPVQASTDSIKQILLNLIKNAVEVLGDKGRIVVTSAGPIFDNGRSHVLLCVSDNGPGMPMEVRERIFQPVATRKGDGHAGLGLAIVGELVAKMQGRIECRSSEAGTLFEVMLPVAVHMGDNA